MTKEQFEKIMAQIVDCKYEADKIIMICEKYTGKSQKELLTQFDYANNELYKVGNIEWKI